MLLNFIVALFLGGFPSVYASVDGDISHEWSCITHDADRWVFDFTRHVANDTGAKHFGAQILSFKTMCDKFEQVKICALYTNLRCATCFAMTINPNVDENIFTAALEECHEAEVYQILVAADSYYKGQGHSQKFQKLKQLALQNMQNTPEELSPQCASSAHPEDLAQKARQYQRSILEKDLTWLRTWEDSYKKLSDLLQHHNDSHTTNIFDKLMCFCSTAPYVLHHLEKAHFQKYAHTLIPALLKEDNLSSLLQKMLASFPGDPQKEELFSFLRDLTHMLTPSASLQPHTLKICSISHAVSSTTSFDYYLQHHAPYIFEIHEQVLNEVYKQLEPFCGQEEKKVCQDWLKWVKKNNTSHKYSLLDRHATLETFHTLRCRILWQLSEKEPLHCDFLPLYRRASYSEKQALRFHVRTTPSVNTIGRRILALTRLPGPTKDLSRISIAEFMDNNT